MSEVEEVTGETASEKELLTDNESDGDPLAQPKATIVVPAADAAPTKPEVISMCLLPSI